MIELRGWLKDWRVEVIDLSERGPAPRLADTGEVCAYMVRVDVPTSDTWESRDVVITHTFAYPRPERPPVHFVLECVRRAALHEVDEGFWVNGTPLENPHNKPDSHNALPPWARHHGAMDSWHRELLYRPVSAGRIDDATRRR